MHTIDFKHPCHVHFIGIGGISMSGLAGILKNEGFTVTGSDRQENPQTRALAEAGIPVAYPQAAENIRRFAPIDLIVYTAAIHPDNPEYAQAKADQIPMLTRAELLGALMAQYPSSAAIAGTHGKTTTTAMLSQILIKAGMDPTISVGGVFKPIGGNVRIGSAKAPFVTEACEYTNSFLSRHPSVSIILDIEEDHMDFFKDLADIRRSFAAFASQTLPGGTVVIGSGIEDHAEITRDVKDAEIVTFGLDEAADVRAQDIRHDGLMTVFTLLVKGQPPQAVTLSVPGDHNVLNALAAIAAACALGVSADTAADALKDFPGTERRFERLGTWHGATIIDDYAHHPTEIRATLAAARSLGFSRIWCAFQPHTYTRTKAFFDDFADALSGADHVVLADIYPARETDDLGVSSRQLMEKIRNLGHTCDYFPSFSEIKAFLEKKVSEGDLLIFMGAGEIDSIGLSLVSGD